MSEIEKYIVHNFFTLEVRTSPYLYRKIFQQNKNKSKNNSWV